MGDLGFYRAVFSDDFATGGPAFTGDAFYSFFDATPASLSEDENTFGFGWGTRKNRIAKDDEMAIQIILQAAPFVI